MDKFTLYDLLGLLLPGAVLVWLFNQLNILFGISSINMNSANWELTIGVVFCLAIIFGSMLYALNFWLVAKGKFYQKITGTYQHVAELFLKLTSIHHILIETLNKKARVWCDQDIFFKKDSFNDLTASEKDELRNLQDDYYQRMYYELEYYDKIDNAKTFQSFYYFFRQLLLACIITILLGLIIYGLSFIPVLKLTQPELESLVQFDAGIIITLFLSVAMARWYRRRMVQKMYWAYYTHLNQPPNQ